MLLQNGVRLVDNVLQAVLSIDSHADVVKHPRSTDPRMRLVDCDEVSVGLK